MKPLTRIKLLTPLIIGAALLLGFGSAFAARSVWVKPVTKTAAHEEEHEHTNGSLGTITADASVQNLTPNKTIDLKGTIASPSEVSLPVGQVLQFNTKDGMKHRIALGEGGKDHDHTSATDSGVFGAGEAWRVRLDTVGTYYFHDHFNPEINILVVVYKPAN